MDLFKSVLEQFGAFFELRERLSGLSSSNPVAATLVIFAIALVAANTLFSQYVEFRKKFLKVWIHSKFALLWLTVVASAAALISVSIVLNLRKAAAPVPVLLVESDTIIGRPLLLSWKYENLERKDLQFELQSAKARRFESLVEHSYRNGHAWLVGSVNSKLYWRVRAVDAGHIPVSGWSAPIRITQYDNSLKRITDTHSVSVYISNSLNQGLFEFQSNDGVLKGYDIAVVSHIVAELAAQLSIEDPITISTVLADWQELLLAPKNGRADIVISAITALSDREDTLGLKFSKPYFCTTQSLLFKSNVPVAPIEQMIQNKRIGIISKTTSEDLIKQYAGKFNVRNYDEGAQMVADIAKGEIDFGLTDTPFARGAQLQYGPGTLTFKELVNDQDLPRGIPHDRRQERYALAVRSGEETLIKAIDRIIDEMRSDKLGAFLEQATDEFYNVGSDQTRVDRRKDPSVCTSS